MNILPYCAAAIVAAFASLYLKSVRAEYAALVGLAAVIFIMAGVLPALVALISDVTRFASSSGVSEKYIEPIFKIIGIAYVAQIGSDVCEDAGEKAIASHVELCGKAAIAIIALPMVKDVFSLILGLLG